jgi:hypothetical protein
MLGLGAATRIYVATEPVDMWLAAAGYNDESRTGHEAEARASAASRTQ